LHGSRIVFLDGEIEKLRGVAQAGAEAIETADQRVELRALTPELLRLFGSIPDARILELARNFVEPIPLAIVLKDTPVASWNAPRDP
jgi:hypothetical protein